MLPRRSTTATGMAPPSRNYISTGSPSVVDRLSLVSGHLAGRNQTNISNLSAVNQSRTMSSQPPHPTLLIPGPIEFDDAVLNAMSHYR